MILTNIQVLQIIILLIYYNYTRKGKLLLISPSKSSIFVVHVLFLLSIQISGDETFPLSFKGSDNSCSLIKRRVLNGGQQRKASLDKDITVRIIAFYGRVNYSSQVFARVEAPQKRVGSLSSRLFLGRGGRDNIQLTVPRDKSLVDYVYYTTCSLSTGGRTGAWSRIQGIPLFFSKTNFALVWEQTCAMSN